MLDLKSLLRLFRHISVQSFEKGETIIPKGGTKKNVYFIRKGLVRSYFLNEKSEEITFHLFPESHVFGNVHAIMFDEPSHFNFHALERTKVYVIDYESYYNLVPKHPIVIDLNSKYFSKKILKQAFQRVESFVILSPEERYKKYQKDYPNVINRVPDKYIAHVLGITPVSLSRIRNRIATQKK